MKKKNTTTNNVDKYIYKADLASFFVCPKTGGKAHCIGCPDTMTCIHRPDCFPRVFPKVRKGAIRLNIKELVRK